MSILHEIPAGLKSYLDEHGAHYELIPHPRDYSAQRAAADTHTPGSQFAKCVLIRLDGAFAMVVLPADHRLDLDLLCRSLNARSAGLVREEDMQKLFPDCEIGAEPPFGKLYALPVYIATALAAQTHITFNAGTHEEVIRMPFAEFQRLTEPRMIACSVKPYAV